MDLLKQQGISDDKWHIVWLGNLFTSAWLLTILRELGFGAAGTVRTTKTKREEQEEKNGEPDQKKQKEKNRGLDSNLSDLKIKSNSFKRVDPLCFDDCRSPQDWSRCGLHDWRRGIHPKGERARGVTLGLTPECEHVGCSVFGDVESRRSLSWAQSIHIR